MVARGKPAYDDATEIYGRSAHPFGLSPERRIESRIFDILFVGFDLRKSERGGEVRRVDQRRRGKSHGALWHMLILT